MNCSAVIPVYKGQATLPALIERLEAVRASLSEKYEMILVNDGSPDQSWDVILSLAEKYPHVRGIDLLRNYGQHNATLCGILAAQYEVIITLDDDLQHPPEEIPNLLAKLAEGYDVVYGVPRRRPHSWWRNSFSVLAKFVLSYVMGIPTVRDIGSFRAFRARLRKSFEKFNCPDVIVDVLLSWGTHRFSVVQVSESPRTTGTSNYSFFKLVRLVLIILTAFSTAPLRLASITGFLFMLMGIGVFVYVLIIYFSAGSIPGFPFLASLISIFSGAQLFALGIIGEYLARIFDRTATRPCFTVGQTTGEPFA